jgi:voltage-gated potassium channel
MVKEELLLFFAATCFLLFVAAVGIYYFENPTQPEHFKSVFHSMWWAVATLTTVGYGDIVPVTAGGRAFTFIILMLAWIPTEGNSANARTPYVIDFSENPTRRP